MDALTKLAAKKHLAESLQYSLIHGMDKEAAWKMDTILASLKSGAQKAKSVAQKAGAETKTIWKGTRLSKARADLKAADAQRAKWGGKSDRLKETRKMDKAKVHKEMAKTYGLRGTAGVAGAAGLAALARAAAKGGKKGMSKSKLMKLMKQHKGKLIAGGAGAAGLGALAAAKS